MRNKGFTLIELLAVVTIISLLLVLVVPKITSQLNNSKDEVNSATKKIIYKAAEKYVQDYNINKEEYESNEYCLTVKELIDENYLTDEITDNKLGINIKEKKTVKITYDNVSGFSYELMNSNECDDAISHGLTPVIYKDDKWVVVSPLNKNNEWYDYDNQKWANAVTLLPGVKKEVGDEVKVDGTEASMMLVWIPRFEYKIEEPYGKGGTDAEHPGEIEVNFIKNTQLTSDDGYILHPAFEFGNTDNDKQHLSGIWVGKFELSHETKTTTSMNCTEDTCSESQYLRVLPDKSSLRNNTISSFFYGIRSIEKSLSFGLSNIDTHLMKNSEWGAVVYLSQSKYGKYGNPDYNGSNKEVYQNKNTFITGSSSGIPSQGTIYPNCTYNQKKGTSANQDQNNCGMGASTTGNIYGVYDMSGGAHELVMGAYGNEKNPTSGLSGFEDSAFTSERIETKYYDIYITNNSSTACNGICCGHALSETEGWYNDYTTMVNNSFSWFIRGGFWDGRYSGIFYYTHFDGSSDAEVSTRVVFTAK